jgi:hypothetical protein
MTDKTSPLRFKAVNLEQALARASELLAKHPSDMTTSDKIEATEKLLAARTWARELKQDILARELDQSFAPKPSEVSDPETIRQFTHNIVAFQESRIKESGNPSLLLAFDRDYFTLTRMSAAMRYALADAFTSLAIQYKLAPLAIWQQLLDSSGNLDITQDEAPLTPPANT